VGKVDRLAVVVAENGADGAFERPEIVGERFAEFGDTAFDRAVS